MDSTRPHQPLVAENFTNNIDVFPSREDLLDQSTDGLDEFASDFVSDVDSQQDRDSYYRPSTPFAQKLASLDPSLYTGSGDDFCTEDNFDQTSAHVNHQLGLYGYVSNLRFLDGDMHSATRIVSTFFKLLQQHQRDIKYKEEIELNWKRLTRDYDNTAQTLSEVKAQLERSRRDVDTLSARTESLEGDLRVEADKHRNTREELKAAKANLQFTKTQHTHELRKKEQEMNILKDKVQKTINRNQSTGVSSTISGGITVLNPVPRTLYGKQPTNDAEQLLKNVIEQQTTREGEIVEENEQLRKALYTVHTELEGLLQKQTSPKSAATNLYGLPFEMIRDNIESEIRDTLTLLSDQWNHQATREPEISPTELVVRDQRIEELQHEVERMQLELEDSTALIQGAQQMIDNLTQGNFLAGVQDFKLNVDGSDMTLQELNEAETKLQQQKTKLEKERKDYTQACLKLGRERENLQREKLEFEEAKRTYTVDKFMSLLSSPPTSSKRTKETSPNSPTLQSSMPSRKRAAPSIQIDLSDEVSHEEAEMRHVRPRRTRAMSPDSMEETVLEDEEELLTRRQRESQESAKRPKKFAAFSNANRLTLEQPNRDVLTEATPTSSLHTQQATDRVEANRLKSFTQLPSRNPTLSSSLENRRSQPTALSRAMATFASRSFQRPS